MLTLFDRLRLAFFTIVVIFFTLGQALLVLGGMALGFAAALIAFALLSRRFVSPATHQRWAEYLADATFASRQYPGPFRLIRWVLLPKAYRAPQASVRSNNRWGG
jgi:hypothetical protein